MPSEEARRLYLTTMNPRLVEEEEELDLWVEVSKDYSIAHLKEMIIAVEALGQELPDVVARLDRMKDCKPSSEDDFGGSEFGFGAGSNTVSPAIRKKFRKLVRESKRGRDVESVPDAPGYAGSEFIDVDDL